MSAIDAISYWRGISVGIACQRRLRPTPVIEQHPFERRVEKRR